DSSGGGHPAGHLPHQQSGLSTAQGGPEQPRALPPPYHTLTHTHTHRIIHVHIHTALYTTTHTHNSEAVSKVCQGRSKWTDAGLMLPQGPINSSNPLALHRGLDCIID